MSTTIDHQGATAGGAGKGVTGAVAEGEAIRSRLTSDQVWHQLAKASFAVVSYVTPTGKPRSSGVVFTTVGRRLYFATAVDSWKARQITANGQVAVTVPVRRGGIMSLLLPIPPATITFHASAIVHPASKLKEPSLAKQLAPLQPAQRRTASRVIEVIPEGQFLTYGIRVPLRQTANPDLALARVPVA
jgi:Pyridoxamine 5'-phosphate oxidase